MSYIPTVIAIDPGEKRSGIALFVNGRLTGVTHVDQADQVVAIQTIEKLAAHAGVEPGEINQAVIENWTYLRGAAATKSLAASQRTWKDACKRLYIAVEFVNSNTWQGALGMGGTLPSATRKFLARSVAGKELGREPRVIDENEADAVCIGRWFLDEWCFKHAPKLDWTGEVVGETGVK